MTRAAGAVPLTAIEVSSRGTTLTISPVGEIDVASAPAMASRLASALTSGAEIVVLDLAGASFIDTRGVRIVMEARARADRVGVRLVLLPGPPVVQRVFELLSELAFVKGDGAREGRTAPNPRVRDRHAGGDLAGGSQAVGSGARAA